MENQSKENINLEAEEVKEEVKENTNEQTNEDQEIETSENQEIEVNDDEHEEHSRFSLNINIDLSNGPIKRQDGASFGTKILGQNLGYRGRFTLRYGDGYKAKATGAFIHVLSKPQITFGKHLGFAFPAVFLVTSEELDKEDLKKGDLIALTATIAESPNINEKTNMPFITLDNIESVSVIKRSNPKK